METKQIKRRKKGELYYLWLEGKREGVLTIDNLYYLGEGMYVNKDGFVVKR